MGLEFHTRWWRGSISSVETSAPARLPSAMLQPSNRFGWMGRGRGPAVGLMIARSVTAACPRIGGAARPAFEVVRVIIDHPAVAAKTRSLVGGTQFLQLARADAQVMGHLRGEIGRASCRERACQYVWNAVVAVS